MKIRSNLDLTSYNSYRIKSYCQRALFPESIQEVLDYLKNPSAEFEVIGGGYNIILSKEYYNKDFLILAGELDDIKLMSKEVIFAQVGTTMKNLCLFALKHKLKGLEKLYDIPGSIGGAIAMNAGANGIELKDLLEEVYYYDLRAKHTIVQSTNELSFEYRSSKFQKNKNLIILGAKFKLEYDKNWPIQKTMKEIEQKRKVKHPQKYPNAGSVFKRPKGYFVGKLIEDLGLKGYTIGDAQVSKKHAGFIVNKGNASGKEIIELIHHIQQKVKRAYGLELEIEQRIL